MLRKTPAGFLLMISILNALGQENKPFSQLQELNGVWIAVVQGKTIYESWKTDKPNKMSGMSYSIHGADTLVFEQTKIVIQNDRIAYLATVKNQNQGREVSFKLVSSENKTFVFQNAEHDFPQQVIYQFASADSLHAWIAGKYKGKDSREDYYYKRLK